MFRTVFGVAVVAVALVALAGCRAQETEKPEQREAARKAANYNAFRDPAVREALKSDPDASQKYSLELEDNALLPGGAPSTGAVETPPTAPSGETPPASGETAPAAAETPPAAAETPPAGEADKPAAGEGEAAKETPTE